MLTYSRQQYLYTLLLKRLTVTPANSMRTLKSIYFINNLHSICSSSYRVVLLHFWKRASTLKVVTGVRTRIRKGGKKPHPKVLKLETP